MPGFELLLIYWEPRTASTFYIKKPRLKKEPSQHLGDCLCRFLTSNTFKVNTGSSTLPKEKQRSLSTSAPPNTAFPLQFSLTVQQPEMIMILFVLSSAILISEATKKMEITILLAMISFPWKGDFKLIHLLIPLTYLLVIYFPNFPLAGVKITLTANSFIYTFGRRCAHWHLIPTVHTPRPTSEILVFWKASKNWVFTSFRHN